MNDREIVSAIMGDDPAGLAAAFDKYGGGLYAYCRSQLADAADAADAVRDTFAVAVSDLARLREPAQLRAWLFAVARSECQGRIQAGEPAAAGLASSGEPLSGTAAETAAETSRNPGKSPSTQPLGESAPRFLARAAVASLEPGERELIELSLRAGLKTADLTEILGVPRVQAEVLAARARFRFRSLLKMLLATWLARAQCSEMAHLLEGWDGTLPAPLREQVSGHIKRCPNCGKVKPHKFDRAALPGLLPAAALPAQLREQVLQPGGAAEPVTSSTPAGQHLSPFGVSGFPVPAAAPSSSRRGGYVLASAAAVAAVALLGGGVLLVDHANAQAAQTANTKPSGAVHALPATGGATRPAAGPGRRALSPSHGTAVVPTNPAQVPTPAVPPNTATAGVPTVAPAKAKATPTAKPKATPTVKPKATPTATAPTTAPPTAPATPTTGTGGALSGLPVISNLLGTG